MKKKLIAALCIQLAAVVMLLCYPHVLSVLVTRYGKEYSVPANMDCCEENISDEKSQYQIYVYSKGPVDIEVKEYKRIPNKTGEIFLWVDETVMSVEAGADYYIKDTALGERMYNIFGRSSMSDEFQSLYPLSMANDVKMNFRVLGSRAELVSVTINGKSPEDFFAENISEYEENSSFINSFFDS